MIIEVPKNENSKNNKSWNKNEYDNSKKNTHRAIHISTVDGHSSFSAFYWFACENCVFSTLDLQPRNHNIKNKKRTDTTIVEQYLMRARRIWCVWPRNVFKPRLCELISAITMMAHHCESTQTHAKPFTRYCQAKNEYTHTRTHTDKQFRTIEILSKCKSHRSLLFGLSTI